jgi:hypothetical protein
MRWGAAIRGCFFVHTAAVRPFDQTGVSRKCQVFARENAGEFKQSGRQETMPNFLDQPPSKEPLIWKRSLLAC